jgi:hypothetical protein
MVDHVRGSEVESNGVQILTKQPLLSRGEIFDVANVEDEITFAQVVPETVSGEENAAQLPAKSFSLALARSRSQRPIGHTVLVKTEFVFAEPGAKRSVALLGEYDRIRAHSFRQILSSDLPMPQTSLTSPISSPMPTPSHIPKAGTTGRRSH